MDTGRDLACPALWQESLERSLARRGRPTRSSLELFHLRAERDLSRPDLLRESLMYSQLRRSAVARRPSLAVPGAGGISALALLAVTTLPGLLGGRSGGRERIAYRAGATDAQAANAPLWQNEITVESLVRAMEYVPSAYVDLLAPKPLRLQAAMEDALSPLDVIEEVFGRAGEPKRLEVYPCRHFEIYDSPYRDEALDVEVDWLNKYLV